MVYRKSGEQDIDDNGFIVNYDEIFPRQHPSAQLALNLGWSSLVLGAVAGIPAIVVARLVLREIDESEGRYDGTDLAERGERLGGVGTYLNILILLFALSYWSSTATLIGAALAIAGGAVAWAAHNSNKSSTTLGHRLRHTTGAAAICGVVVASGAGFVRERQAEQSAHVAAMAQCDTLLREAELAIAANTFTQAKTHIETARASCLGNQVRKLAAVHADLVAKDAAHNARVEKETAERRAKAERETKEKRQRDFEASLQDATKALKDASDAAARGKWLDANAHTDRASSSLRDVAWPEFVEEKRWLDATKQVDAMRKRIATPLEQIRKAEAAARERQVAAEQAAQRQAAAVEAAREASKHLLCNDGTRSPSCLCNRESWRGCCSRHGGVAGCE